MSIYLPLIARLIAVGLLFLVGFGGYRFGVSETNNRWQAQANHAARVAQERFDAEQLRGQGAVASLTTERQAFAASYTHLAEQFHDLSARVPLLARPLRSVPAVLPVAAPSGDGDRPSEGIVDSEVHPGGGNPALSDGAVWMWNSSLSGQDQPSGACGSADTSEAACAVASPYSLDDAWRNHAINAQQCAEDRLNHQRLIDFINAQPSEERAP